MATSKVTEGLLFFYGTTGRGFTLHTKNLMATLELADSGSFPIPSGPDKPGDIINVSGILSGGQTLRYGPAYYNGTSYAQLWYEGTLKFQARKVTAPGNSSSPVAIHSAFKFSGTLKAYQSNNISGGGGPAVFNVRLTGKGRATVHLGTSYDVGGGTLARDARAWLYYF